MLNDYSSFESILGPSITHSWTIQDLHTTTTRGRELDLDAYKSLIVIGFML